MAAFSQSSRISTPSAPLVTAIHTPHTVNDSTVSQPSVPNPPVAHPTVPRCNPSMFTVSASIAPPTRHNHLSHFMVWGRPREFNRPSEHRFCTFDVENNHLSISTFMINFPNRAWVQHYSDKNTEREIRQKWTLFMEECPFYCILSFDCIRIN